MHCKRPRLKTFDYLGFHRYFLTFCTGQRHKAFANQAVVALVRPQILSAAQSRGFAILAYVFMHDHVHLLAEGIVEAADMKSFVSLGKQKSGHAYSREYRKQLWQPSYHDRVLRDEDDTWDVIRYIVNNPVRGRLVDDYTKFPFLGSGVMGRDQLVSELAFRETRRWQP